MKSSAMSDTSEAPSLASHVRRVRVPSQASDVDQFLDELFMPVLDGNLDELSDARSLAASIKGLEDRRRKPENLNEFLNDVVKSDLELPSARELAGKIKGDGNMDIPNHNPAFNYNSMAPGMMSPQMMIYPTSSSGQSPNMNMGPGFMPIPIYNMQGLNLPQYQNSSPNSQNNNENIQRAFLQNAMAQNIQIQQQLLAQNQALHQLLVQRSQNSPQPVNFIFYDYLFLILIVICMLLSKYLCFRTLSTVKKTAMFGAQEKACRPSTHRRQSLRVPK